MKKIKTSSREAAYLAYLSSQRGEAFINESLTKWKFNENPSEKDYRLAQEIAYGTCRMALSLDYFAKQLSDKKLNLKRKERSLLYTALYQFFFLERVPLYAITNESIAISKKHCHSNFTKFLNAVLRKLPSTKLSLPDDESINSLSIKYSYPEFFVEQLVENYDLQQAKNIMASSNLPGKTQARVRCNEPTLPVFLNEEVKMVSLENITELQRIVASPDYYIQNITPALLIHNLAKNTNKPSSILDLCSSPGGKLISCHDIYPKAKLYANDVSEKKLEILRQNLDKYSIEATISQGLGQNYSSKEKFDLIILDVPCSNTGVLNKRPEARWRLTQENIKELNTIQHNLLQKAIDLLSPAGEIWFMTCSILKEENESLITEFAKEHNLKVRMSKTVIPNDEGYDGGFACALSK